MDVQRPTVVAMPEPPCALAVGLPDTAFAFEVAEDDQHTERLDALTA